MKNSLEDTVRDAIGASGPQHDSELAYVMWVDARINRMENVELLQYISMALSGDLEATE